jgi:hypothetical protein
MNGSDFTPFEHRMLAARGLNRESLGDTTAVREALTNIRTGSPRCDLCAHWEVSDREPDEYRRPCGVTPDQYQEGDAAQVVIDDPYCYMMTKANHGCVLWKPIS